MPIAASSIMAAAVVLYAHVHFDKNSLGTCPTFDIYESQINSTHMEVSKTGDVVKYYKDGTQEYDGDTRLIVIIDNTTENYGFNFEEILFSESSQGSKATLNSSGSYIKDYNLYNDLLGNRKFKTFSIKYNTSNTMYPESFYGFKYKYDGNVYTCDPGIKNNGTPQPPPVTPRGPSPPTPPSR